jgi:hypothetical protein
MAADENAAKKSNLSKVLKASSKYPSLRSFAQDSDSLEVRPESRGVTKKKPPSIDLIFLRAFLSAGVLVQKTIV